jgi:hypothetical protein
LLCTKHHVGASIIGNLGLENILSLDMFLDHPFSSFFRQREEIRNYHNFGQDLLAEQIGLAHCLQLTPFKYDKTEVAVNMPQHRPCQDVID